MHIIQSCCTYEWGLFCRKRLPKIRHPMHLHHPATAIIHKFYTFMMIDNEFARTMGVRHEWFVCISKNLQKRPTYPQIWHACKSVKTQAWAHWTPWLQKYCNILPKHCDTLRHTATHRSTLQQTATHCNTLQHTATHCSTLQHTAKTPQHTAIQYNTLQHTAKTLQHTASQYNILQHTATHCKNTATHCITIQHTATHCNTLQHTAKTLQHTASQYNTLQHTATHCNTLQNAATHCNTRLRTHWIPCLPWPWVWDMTRPYTLDVWHDSFTCLIK